MEQVFCDAAGRKLAHVFGQSMENCQQQEAHRVGRRLLCEGLRSCFGIDVTEEDLEDHVAFGAQGKPAWRDDPALSFSISHCSGWTVCALADRPIGIDVEQRRSVSETLRQRVLAKTERQTFHRLVQEGQDPELLFLRYWTAKESYLKMIGAGLSRDPREVPFSLLPDEPDWIVRCEEGAAIFLQKQWDVGTILTLCLPSSASSEY